MRSILGSGIRVCLSAVLLLVAMVSFVNAQAFQNLNFEATQIELDDQGDPTGDVIALPGWTLWPTQLDGAVFLWGHLGIQPQNFVASDLYESSQDPLAGHFSVYMENGLGCAEASNPHNCDFEEDAQLPVSPYFSQTALVPASAQSIRLRATPLDPFYLRETHFDHEGVEVPGDPDAAAWQLYMNGNRLHVYDLGGGQFGSNVPNFAGTVATLTMRLDVDYFVIGWSEDGPVPFYAEGTFDSFQFSTEHIVPEAGSCLMLLFALGVSVLLKRSVI